MKKREALSLLGRRNVIPKFVPKGISKGFLVLTRTHAESMRSKPASNTGLEIIKIVTTVLIGGVLWVHLLIFPYNKRFVSTGRSTWWMFPYCLFSQGIAILSSCVHLQNIDRGDAIIAESRHQFLDGSNFILQILKRDDSMLPQIL